MPSSLQRPTAAEIEQLQHALLDAYGLAELEQMVRTQLDAELAQLVPIAGRNLAQIAYDLVRAYAARPDGFAALARAGLAERPKSVTLQAAAAAFGDREFALLPLPAELESRRCAIYAQIGDHVKNVAIGSNINQTIVEGDVITGRDFTGRDFIGRDQINNYFVSGEQAALFVGVPAPGAGAAGRLPGRTRAQRLPRAERGGLCRTGRPGPPAPARPGAPGFSDGPGADAGAGHRPGLEDLVQVKPEAVDAFHALGAFAPKPATFDLAAAKVVTGADAVTLALLIARSLMEQEEEALALHQTLSDVARTQLPAEAVERHRAHYVEILPLALSYNLFYPTH